MVEFNEELDIRPLPVGADMAPHVVAELRSEIDTAGSLEAAAAAIADRMLALDAAGSGSEQHRLQSLYAAAYTRDELVTLARNTFTSFGLGG